MTLAEWLELLQRRHHRAIDLGLERVERVRRAQGLQLTMPLMVVGGTNGKGSVCALADAALNAAGFRCGCYLSPHLIRFNERVRINGEDANDEQLLYAFDKTERARKAAKESLTYFEFTTLAAAQCIVDAECDCAVLEVGMGGRLDAVNIFKAAAAVITNVGLDHCEFLGDSIDAIAGEKAGIFHSKAAAIIGDSNAPPILAQCAESNGGEVSIAGRDFAAVPICGIFAGANGSYFHCRRRFLMARINCKMPQPHLPLWNHCRMHFGPARVRCAAVCARRICRDGRKYCPGFRRPLPMSHTMPILPRRWKSFYLLWVIFRRRLRFLVCGAKVFIANQFVGFA